MKHSLLFACLAAGFISVAHAKLPAPTDEAVAAAAAAKEKADYGTKVAAYKLCLAQDRVAATYRKSAAAAGKPVGAATATPACADPGPFVPAAPVPAAPKG